MPRRIRPQHPKDDPQPALTPTDAAPHLSEVDLLQTMQNRKRSSLSAQGILGLQRRLGNQAVQRLLNQAEAPPQRHPNNRLPDNIQNGVEQLSGVAMDDVTVHYDSPQPAQIGALAYTTGTDIHVGSGQETHLAHEAWHVVQQKQGRVAANTQLKSQHINTDSTLEHEADEMGAKAQQMGTYQPSENTSQAPLRHLSAQSNVVQGFFAFSKSDLPPQLLQFLNNGSPAAQQVNKVLAQWNNDFTSHSANDVIQLVQQTIQQASTPTPPTFGFGSSSFGSPAPSFGAPTPSFGMPSFSMPSTSGGFGTGFSSSFEPSKSYESEFMSTFDPMGHLSSLDEDIEEDMEVGTSGSPMSDPLEDPEHIEDIADSATEQPITLDSLADGFDINNSGLSPEGKQNLVTNLMRDFQRQFPKHVVTQEAFLVWYNTDGVFTRSKFKKLFPLRPQKADVIYSKRKAGPSYQASYTGSYNGFAYQNIEYMRGGDGNIAFHSKPGTNAGDANPQTWSNPVITTVVDLEEDNTKPSYGILKNGNEVNIPRSGRSRHFSMANRLADKKGWTYARPNDQSSPNNLTWHHLSSEYEMVLVDREAHRLHGHNGGNLLWK